MPQRQSSLSQVFFAVCDPTRRAVLKRLAAGPASVSELAEPFGMALPSFMQHIEMLAEYGLIRTKKVGRVRRCALAPGRLKAAEAWVAELRALAAAEGGR
jgi:DNA-binding transcriptional ArsR family regulator